MPFHYQIVILQQPVHRKVKVKNKIPEYCKCNYLKIKHVLSLISYIAIPGPPVDFTVTQVERVPGGGSVNIAASWMLPFGFEQIDIANYTLRAVSSDMGSTSKSVDGRSTNTILMLPETNNPQMSTTFTVDITATNLCGETGSAATAIYILSSSMLIYSLCHLMILLACVRSLFVAYQYLTRDITWEKSVVLDS